MEWSNIHSKIECTQRILNKQNKKVEKTKMITHRVLIGLSAILAINGQLTEEARLNAHHLRYDNHWFHSFHTLRLKADKYTTLSLSTFGLFVITVHTLYFALFFTRSRTSLFSCKSDTLGSFDVATSVLSFGQRGECI